VLQEREFERVGGNQPLTVDVRIIAATNQDLEARIVQSRFREDLYYRVKVVEIRVPPLRERREDIPQMVQHFIRDACHRFGLPEKQLAPAAMRACVEAPWRGNARALKSTLEQAVILSSATEISADELFSGSSPDGVHAPAERARAAKPNVEGAIVATFREAKEKFVEQWERDFVLGALRATGGNISRAAERAGMYRQSFQQKMRELGISPSDIGDGAVNDEN